MRIHDSELVLPEKWLIALILERANMLKLNDAANKLLVNSNENKNVMNFALVYTAKSIWDKNSTLLLAFCGDVKQAAIITYMRAQ